MLLAHGDTRKEVLEKMQESLTALWLEGEVVQIDMPSAPKSSKSNPLLTNFGRFKDDPTFDDLLNEISMYRLAIDSAENVE